MNKDIETSLKDLRLRDPAAELKDKVLANARKSWNPRTAGGSLKLMQFRRLLATAAALLILTGIIAILNISEGRKMQQAMARQWGNGWQKSEKARFLEDLGLGKEYSNLIAGISTEKLKLSNISLISRDLNL